jgi:ABC-type Fe3+-hydroxamate transport system substrate-binding protein
MTATQLHTDQIGRNVEVVMTPQRVVSLVPSQTELLFDLGLAERVVGITKFCIHPEQWFRTKTHVGGTKQLRFDVIESLNPDLIIANKEENNQEDIERLEKKFPVWVSDVNSLDSALEMIQRFGEITDSDSSKMIHQIGTAFDGLKPYVPKKKAVYLIWKKPYMGVGVDTFINDMLGRCGLENVVTDGRYPELTEEQIVELNPDIVLLSSEPFPFGPTHTKDLSGLLPNATIRLVDGEMFSWYGSRMKLAPFYFSDLIGSISK